MKTRKASDFFKNDYVNYASYASLRKIPSIVDGQKNAARKILWFSLNKPLKSELKVSQLDSKVAEETEYLHGSMAGVIVRLAQDYVGTNNMNLMMPEGNFGTRLVPEASAPRYIYTYGSPHLFNMFNKVDNEILEDQVFEGRKIEPKFMVPKLPILLINGGADITPGFKAVILPRNPEEIKNYITRGLKDGFNEVFDSLPWFNGFKGTVTKEDDKVVIEGVIKRVKNVVHIDELPIGYSLAKYLKILDKLEADKKILQYNDYSDSSFKFEVKFNKATLDGMTDDELITLLKLRKKVTEKYTVMSEENRVLELSSVDDIMKRFIEIKFRYLTKRKEYLVESMIQDIKWNISRYLFIKKVQNDEIIISKRDEKDIIEDITKEPKIVTKNGTYEYLLGMQIRSMTNEKMLELMNKIKIKKIELDKLKKQTPEKIWLDEIEEMK